MVMDAFQRIKICAQFIIGNNMMSDRHPATKDDERRETISDGKTFVALDHEDSVLYIFLNRR
jgi:hypothetical protein